MPKTSIEAIPPVSRAILGVGAPQVSEGANAKCSRSTDHGVSDGIRTGSGPQAVPILKACHLLRLETYPPM